MITTVGCVGDISGSKGDDLRDLPLPELKAEIGRIYEAAIAGPGKEREMCMPMPLLVCALCHTVTNHSWLRILYCGRGALEWGCLTLADTDRQKSCPLPVSCLAFVSTHPV
jgi:hypothetical protein